jgi:hypothetical protein
MFAQLMILGSLLFGAPQEAGTEVSRAKELLAEITAPRTGSSIKGQPVNLVVAIGSAYDGKTRFEIVQSYWRLVQQLAEYNNWLDYNQQLESLRVPPHNSMLLKTARAVASASLREAELAVLAAQHELASVAQLPTSSPLPLPADRPHVGSYRTLFNELFTGRPVPARARLLDQTLPLRQQAIDARATALIAAQDAAVVEAESHRAERSELTNFLSCLQEVRQQKSALMVAVRQYNDEIADYVFNIVIPNATGRPDASAQNLVDMLITSSKGAAGSAAAGKKDAGDSSAANVKPKLVPPETPPPSTYRTGPSDSVYPGRGSEQAPPGRSNDAATPSADPTPIPTNPPAKRSPGFSHPSADRDDTVRPMVPYDQKSPSLEPRTANRIEENLPDRLIPPQALYAGLVDAKPAARARELAATLNWDWATPPGNPVAVTLEQCLRDQPAAARQGIIEAYWIARQRAAEYQVLSQQRDLLLELAQTSAEMAPAAQQRLRSAQAAAEAALLEAQSALWIAQFELSVRCGRADNLPPPWPSTAPHAGSYALHTEKLSDSTTQSRAIRRLVDLVPRQAESLQDGAAAVVEADLNRAVLTAAYETGGVPVDRVLDAIARQTQQTQTFLASVTTYNQSIGRYVLAVLPPQVSSAALVASLVVPPKKKG